MTKSEYMNKLRKEMVSKLRREWTKKVCDKCIYDEDKHSSRRLNVTGRYSREFTFLFERATQKFKRHRSI